MRDGRCSCSKDCISPAKHPRVKGGFKAATTDPEVIRAWWAKWPDANIGIATGRVSGIIVYDIDGDEGRATLAAARGQGMLPPTPYVITSRGFHLYYRLLDPESGEISCSTGGGLDIRADGGYVVAPPSVHATGHVYRWGKP